MDIKSFKEIQNNEVVRKRLAKKIVRNCFRDGVFEDFHARGTRLSQEDVKEIMIDSVNRTYKLLTKLSIAMGDQIIDELKVKDEVPKWQDPVEPEIF